MKTPLGDRDGGELAVGMKSEFNQRTSHAHLIYNNFYLRKCETGGEVGQLGISAAKLLVHC